MQTEIRTITPREVASRQDRGENPILLDVRSLEEYQALRARGARLWPLDRFDPRDLGETLEDPAAGIDRPVYLICRGGARAEQAARRMVASGLPNAVVVEGGTDAWARSGLPAIRARRVPSPEQQVQVALGVLLVLKVVFGFAIHPAFFALVGGLGLGLIWAGATRPTGLTRIIQRMPWNRAAGLAARA
jgi:rhodanese-related sulfurtransferase